MHGRVKTRTTEEQKEIARKEKCKKAKAYQDAMKIILEKRNSCFYDQEALDVTANVLTGNPDIISLWNYRREIFLNLKNEKDEDSYQQLLEKDLSLTEQCLRVNPKSYGSWHHRVWVLDNLPKPNWERELLLCTKYLQLDERNFHCWDYRRTVTQRSNVSDESEYKYTLEKIETNFSNYSAWHLRSKLLPKIFPDPEKKFPINEEKHKEELELVENAAFTDPNDQSAWFYLRWLLGLTEPKTSFITVNVKENEVFVVLSKSIKISENGKIGVSIEVKVNEECVKGIWKSNGGIQSCIWSFEPEAKIKPNDYLLLILIENGVKYNQQEVRGYSSVYNKPNFLPSFSPNLMETITNQLSSCEQLLELEPDSKWTLLTSIFLMLSIDRDKFHKEIRENLHKLCQVDFLRKNYYLDLESKITIESAISLDFNKSKKFLVNNQNLTCIYHSQYLYSYEDIDLSCNSLTSDSLKVFNNFIECKHLNLKKNKIESLKHLPVMPKLETLLLDENNIEEVDWDALWRFPSLKNLSLSKNPLNKQSCGEDLADKLKNATINVSIS